MTPSLPGLRSSYPGIRRLVIVSSTWNADPRGRAAIDVVARYFGSLSNATQKRSTAEAASLASKDCTQCQADLARFDGYIKAHQIVETPAGKPDDLTVASVLVSSVTSASVIHVHFTGVEPTVILKSPAGAVLARNPGDVYNADVTLGLEHGQLKMLILVDL